MSRKTKNTSEKKISTRRRESAAERRERIFQERLAVCYDEMKWLYCELYHNDEQAFSYFTEMLRRMYAERSAALHKWDEQRAGSGWYKSGRTLGMCLYVDSFAGTLEGVREHLSYIEECGVNYIHLMPLLKSPEDKSDGGYAVSDFTEVDPRLGSMKDLARLTRDCHKKDIAVCLDFVMNHTSDEHEWAKKAKAGDPDAQARYFFFDGWDVPNQFEPYIPDVFPTTAPGNFTWCSEAGKVVMTMFYPYQWDLNYANPTVFNDMTAAMLNLCNHGVDIVRLDAVPYIWKRRGTDCRNQPEVHSLVRLLRLAAGVVCPGTLLLGEVVMEPGKVMPYFGTVEKPECDMLYNVTTMATTWHTVATKDVRLLEHQLSIVYGLPRKFTFLNYLRSHDDIGWGLDYDFLAQFGTEQTAHKKFLNDFLTGKWPGSPSRGELYNDDQLRGDARLCGTTASLCGIEAAEYEGDKEKLDWTVRRDIMLHAFLLTQSGVPVLYSGDEIGQTNDYTYHDDPLRRDDSRYIHRGRFRWEDAALRSDPSTREGRIFLSLQKLIGIRAALPVFDSAADCWIINTGSDHVLGIGRYHRGQKLLALFNFGDDDQDIWLDTDEPLLDLMQIPTGILEAVLSGDAEAAATGASVGDSGMAHATDAAAGTAEVTKTGVAAGTDTSVGISTAGTFGTVTDPDIMKSDWVVRPGQIHIRCHDFRWLLHKYNPEV